MGIGTFFIRRNADGDEIRDAPSLFAISSLIPLTQTLFLWQGLVTAAVVILVSVLVAYASAPSAENARPVASYGLNFKTASPARETATRPGEWLEYGRCLIY